MPLISTPYFEITCSGKIDNIRHPNCPAVSPGGFDSEDVIKRALDLHWTEQGRGYLCSGCSIDVPLAPATTPKPARKSLKSVPPAATEQFDGQPQ